MVEFFPTKFYATYFIYETRSVFERHNIVNEANIKNASNKVMQFHEDKNGYKNSYNLNFSKEKLREHCNAIH
jgi:hypothetical protein|tara:strand:+ start:1734 stop:1949 length:216 start_codon:yes stop_codon:yes gene_type:complete